MGTIESDEPVVPINRGNPKSETSTELKENENHSQ